MSEDDKKIIGNKKHLYDGTVIYDESNLPNILKEYIKELKKFDEFEMVTRNFLRENIISEYDYKKLIAKYGWLYD